MRFSGPLIAQKIVTKIKRKWAKIIPYTTNVSEWKVVQPFKFYFDDSDPRVYVQVDAGWQTDLASVPGFFGFVIQKDGDFAQAAVTHDWCYKNRGDVVYYDQADTGVPVKLRALTRAEQDKVFLNGMKILGTSLPIRVVMWRAVRRFGWISYPKKA